MDLHAPCLGFEGDCADLPEQFKDLLSQWAGKDEYVCHMFPDEEKLVDTFIVGLIVVALAIPTKSVVEALLDMSNAEGVPEIFMTWPFITRIVAGLFFKRHSWAWADPKTKPNWIFRGMMFREGASSVPSQHQHAQIVKAKQPPDRHY